MHTFAQNINLSAGFIPVDMSSGANTGDWVSLANYNRIAIVMYKAVGTAGDDPTITVSQATDASGTGSKALTFTNIWVKQGTLTSVGTYTLTTQTAANTYTNATLAENAAIIVIEFKADDLDVTNGFTYVQASVADVGNNAQLGCILYALYEPKFAQGTLVSALS